jgi:flagellar FliL protein
MASAAPAPAAAAASTAPAKKGKGKLILIGAAVASVAAGAGLPLAVDVPALLGQKAAADDGHDTKKKKKAKHTHEHLATVAVGDVSVNLAEERMTRYIRLKVALHVVEAQESKVHEHVEKNKAALKSWIISHVSGKSIKDVSGPVGVNRLQREFLERFDDILYPAGDSPIRNVLFEEYIVQ